jgi:hypothetical protein
MLVLMMWLFSADKLQVAAVQGIHQEEVSLYAHLAVHPMASTWLKGLEAILKNTMALTLQACVQTRMEEGRHKISTSG